MLPHEEVNRMLPHELHRYQIGAMHCGVGLPQQADDEYYIKGYAVQYESEAKANALQQKELANEGDTT